MSYSFLGGDPRENFSDQEDLFKVIEGFMGYLPNSHLSMAVNPQLNESFAALAGTIFSSQKIDTGLMQLIALASSLSSGCKYCQAHTSHGAHQAGVNEEKINDILRYQESSHYDDSEKAVLDLAFAAGKTPNQAGQEHFDNLLKYFSKEQIIDMVAVISLFGFLNRWNDTLGSHLEDVPNSFVEEKLKPLGWK